jgi:tripartite-type tricarboxylate transporter receptor subunit TctC
MRALRSLVTGTALAAFALGAAAQAYPSRPVTLVVPFAAGGPTDVVARAVGQAMGKSLGQPVVIENKLGAGGTLAAGSVAKAAPDGYTLFIHHNGMATAPALYRKLPYNPLTDFEPIGQVVDVPMTLLGRKGLPPRNLQELIPYLKANQSKLSLAHAGLGAVSQLCGMLFQQAIGLQLQTIPYKGTAPAMNDLLGGQVDVLCDQTTQTTQYIKAGSVKLYGVTTAHRIKSLPDAPTLDEQGMKGFQVVVWHGLYAPKGTPQPVLERVNAALRAALKDPTVQQRMADLGAEVVPESKQTPEALRSWLKSEVVRYAVAVKAAGVYAD